VTLVTLRYVLSDRTQQHHKPGLFIEDLASES